MYGNGTVSREYIEAVFRTADRKVIYHDSTSIFGGEKKGVRPISGKHRDEQFRLYSELSYYDGAGIRLWLDGVPSTPEEIARACCAREGNSYMRDYVRNSSDKVTDIAFDCIDKDEKTR